MQTPSIKLQIASVIAANMAQNLSDYGNVREKDTHIRVARIANSIAAEIIANESTTNKGTKTRKN